jgi:sarcosine oxidase subunit beta
VAVLEKGYLGGGNTGRNTTIIRSNYLTPEGVAFYDESVRLYQDLAEDFDLNLFYSTRGHFTLAHTDSAVRTMRWRAEVNKHLGVESELVGPEFIQRACPRIDITCAGHAPILGALYHAPGAIARHDAVAWGYGRGADRRGVEIHQQTEVRGIEVNAQSRQCKPRAPISTESTVRRGGLHASHSGHGGNPRRLHPSFASHGDRAHEALAEPDLRFAAHVYVSQSARGELVMAPRWIRNELHSTRSTFDFAELSAHMLDMFPFLSTAKVNRQWAGMAAMTPDFAPIMGKTPPKGFISMPAGEPGASRPRPCVARPCLHAGQRSRP